jgi:putative membrane protein
MIGLADAITLRDRIRRWHGGRVVSDAEPSEAAEPASEPILFEMKMPRILLAGMFNFSLVFLAILFAIFQNLDDIGYIRMEEMVTPERAETASAYFSIRATILFVGLILFLGIIAGVIRTVAREFGFRLSRVATGFRRRRGLLTLSEAVIPLHRMQVGVIDSGAVSGRLGWHGLAFQTLGADQKAGGVQVAAPFATEEEIHPLLEEARFPPPPPKEGWNALPRRALVRWASPWLLLATLVGSAAIFFEPRVGVGALLFALFGLIAVVRWRKHGWAIGERALTVRGGLLSRRTWIIPFDKAQSISLYQGPIQRRLSLASLLVDTAGASLFRSPEIVDIDAADARRLASVLLKRFHQERTRLKAAL